MTDQPVDVPGYAQVPNWIVRDATVSIYAKAVYLALSSHTGRTSTVWPSHATIAAYAGCSERKVREALQELRLLGVISWEQRTTVGGRQSNAYRLLTSAEPRARHTVPLGIEDAPETGAQRHTVPGPQRHTVPGPPAHGAGEEEPVKKNQRRTRAESVRNEPETAVGNDALLPSDDDLVVEAWVRLRKALGDGDVRVTKPGREVVRGLLRGGVGADRIVQVLEWAYADDQDDLWWRTHVTSLGALRRHWARMNARCPREYLDPRKTAQIAAQHRARADQESWAAYWDGFLHDLGVLRAVWDAATPEWRAETAQRWEAVERAKNPEMYDPDPCLAVVYAAVGLPAPIPGEWILIGQREQQAYAEAAV